MLSIGACLVGKTDVNFYAVIKPTGADFVPEAMAVLEPTGLTMNFAEMHGLEPSVAMAGFERWLLEIEGLKNPIFVSHPLGFDWRWVANYFDLYLGRNPFGRTGLDMKSYFAGLTGCDWDDTSKNQLVKRFLPKSPHTHHALDDAIEQAEIFEQMLKARH